MKDFLLSYETVYLRPKLSRLKSRALADTSVEIDGVKFALPVVPANMSDVIGVPNARWLSENNFFYIYHRFGPTADQSGKILSTLEFVILANKEKWKLISISTGTNEKSISELQAIKHHSPALQVDFITIDVAHAHHTSVREMVVFIRKNFPKTRLIVGNVATAEAAEFLYGLGVNIIKVGIGGGSICTTRYKTGFHLPTLQSVQEVANILKKKSSKTWIIADGGAKHYGDIAKALTFGASMLMSGGWFASCVDSPAKIMDGKKIYRGSTSFAAKGENRHIEGRMVSLENDPIMYAERLEEISQSLKSSISYAGGKNLSAFKSVKWARVMP